MIRFFISSFSLAIIIAAGILGVSWIIISFLSLEGIKAKYHNHFYKRELKDRNKIIASLLNSRNR